MCVKGTRVGITCYLHHCCLSPRLTGPSTHNNLRPSWRPLGQVCERDSPQYGLPEISQHIECYTRGPRMGCGHRSAKTQMHDRRVQQDILNWYGSHTHHVWDIAAGQEGRYQRQQTQQSPWRPQIAKATCAVRSSRLSRFRTVGQLIPSCTV